MQAILEQLEKKRAAARMGGGEKRIAAQHSKAQFMHSTPHIHTR